ncbi:non-ribosomal peptide synthetase module [Ammoniphilus sp. CFH 90114]|uniref:non-ribosomal peptide synthetase module n=1 Tax=Ammoniphilus sp. CFH 90114 TaxID=2493665 RepID=UPI00100DDEA0|nr:non-ribosomal peptide synthetase module [Ammoniphilus sp. CFH 90114]RXT15298.1 non-ribosomal peptide synthetase module [Ammoniphilus sp. CFH 90114]
MAQRVATMYKQVKLELSPHQLKEFVKLFETHHTSTQIRVFENGDTEMILFDNGNEIPLVFHPLGPHYCFEGSFVVKDLQLANTMRKAVQECKGHALVHRLYHKHIMEYHYAYGNVVKIQEIRGEKTKLIFEYKDTIGALTRLFQERGVEDQIAWVRLQIDQLLDLRMKVTNKQEIDTRLKELTQELFILEA